MLTSKACGPSTSSPGATSAMDIVATSPADNIAGARLAQPQSGSVSGSKPGPMLQHVGRSPAHTHAANSADVGHYTPDPASIPGVGGGGGGGGGGGSTGVHPGRDNRVEALRWARSIMSEKEWLNPPNRRLMDFVPYAARSLFQEEFGHVISTAALSNDAVHWLVVLRLFPAIVAAPLKRGGATHRHKCSAVWTCGASRNGKSSQRSCGAKNHLGEPPQPANERKPIECKQVQRRHETVIIISRGAAVHDGGQICPDGDEKEAACRKLHPSASANGGHRVQDGQNASRIQLDANSVWAAASTIAKSAALWTQPMHVRTVVGRKQGVIALTTLSTQIINGDVPEEARAWLYPHKLTMLLKESHH